MELKDFSKQLKSHSKQIDHLMRRRLPVIAGRMAKDFFQNSFRISAFVNGGVHHWQTTGRQLAGGKTAASRYGPLLSSRNHLFASIKYTPSDYRVKVANDLLYAPIHNWGGTLHPSVTPKMRRFAWAMFYREAGIKRNASKKSKKKRTDEAAVNPRAQKWRALALTKKKKLSVHIPQRQFLGDSRELQDMIHERTKQEIIKILNSQK
jgi:phage gpG-like protein